MFDNILLVDQWSLSQLESAIQYYKLELLKPHDDTEHNWYLRSIDKCNNRINKLSGTASSWENLFL